MTSHFRVKSGVLMAAFSGLALTTFLTYRAQADSWDKMTLLTISEPTQVMNTYLEPGTYMFRLANSDRHIVQIFNSDRSHLINTVLAIPNYRFNATDRTQFTFWETPPGTAKAVRAWFYPGDHYGQEFTYPTDLRQIAALTPPSLPAPAPPPVPEAALAPPPEPAPAPEPPQAAVEPAPQEQPPVEIAQNSPPPAPEPAAQQPVQTAAPEPESLPKTASPYPAIGLGGLLSLGLYFGLRAKQFR